MGSVQIGCGDFECVADLQPGEIQESAVNSVVNAWAGIDPDGAQARVESFPVGDLRDAIVNTLIQTWSHQDPERVENYLGRTPGGR